MGQNETWQGTLPTVATKPTPLALPVQTYEGGIGGEPGNEAHGGYTFCGLAALILIDRADVLDLPRLLHWAVQCQVTPVCPVAWCVLSWVMSMLLLQHHGCVLRACYSCTCGKAVHPIQATTVHMQGQVHLWRVVAIIKPHAFRARVAGNAHSPALPLACTGMMVRVAHQHLQ